MKLLLALLGKHELAYVNMTSKNVCSIEYLTSHNRISVANFQVLDRSQNYRIYNVRTIV